MPAFQFFLLDEHLGTTRPSPKPHTICFITQRPVKSGQTFKQIQRHRHTTPGPFFPQMADSSFARGEKSPRDCGESRQVRRHMMPIKRLSLTDFRPDAQWRVGESGGAACWASVGIWRWRWLVAGTKRLDGVDGAGCMMPLEFSS